MYSAGYKWTKGVFITLIGVIIIPVLISLFIEWINVSLMSSNIVNLSKLSAEQAAELFTQESYKKSSQGGGMTFVPDVKDSLGNIYISGDFYQTTNPQEIYEKLYTRSGSQFRYWLDNESCLRAGGMIKWSKLNELNDYMFHRGTMTTSVNANSSESDWNKYSQYIEAKQMVDDMYTPLNIGILYLDEETVDRMFKWNIASMFSHCNENNIRRDESGKMYVYYSGYRIYAQDCKITDIEYNCYNLEDSSDLAEFKDITNMDRAEYMMNVASTDESEEQTNVIVLNIKYELSMEYEGISPIARAYNHAKSSRTAVEGYMRRSNKSGHDDSTFNYTESTREYGGDTVDLAAGRGVMQQSGKIVFTNIR